MMILKSFLVLAFVLMTSSCRFEASQDTKAQQASREHYKKSYQRSGGFDPISKSVGQKMQ